MSLEVSNCAHFFLSSFRGAVQKFVGNAYYSCIFL